MSKEEDVTKSGTSISTLDEGELLRRLEALNDALHRDPRSPSSFAAYNVDRDTSVPLHHAQRRNSAFFTMEGSNVPHAGSSKPLRARLSSDAANLLARSDITTDSNSSEPEDGDLAVEGTQSAELAPSASIDMSAYDWDFWGEWILRSQKHHSGIEEPEASDRSPSPPSRASSSSLPQSKSKSRLMDLIRWRRRTIRAKVPIADPELRQHVFAGPGVPPTLRGTVWQALAVQACGVRSNLGRTYVRSLEQTSPWDGIIKRDLARTFPRHNLFKQRDGSGQEALYHVVKAYSLYDPEVNYCQGLGFVVGVALMNVTHELNRHC